MKQALVGSFVHGDGDGRIVPSLPARGSIVHETRASLTAIIVATSRGVANSADGRTRFVYDPYAAELLPAGWSHLVRATDWLSSFAPIAKRCVRAAIVGAGAHIEYRTAAIDRTLVERLQDGWQLVILGAGLDARAWRLPGLARIDVVEIDHPSTQRLKRARIGSRTPRAKSVSFLDVDFTQQSLAGRLEEFGLDRTRPTAWIWEGVTPYLPNDVTRSTLETMADATDGPAFVAMTYALPELSSIPSWLRPLTRQGFFAISEPLEGVMESEQAHHLIRESGFEIVSDTESIEWASDVGGSPPRIRFLERLVVATRES